MLKRIKRAISNLLEKLAKENEKSFGKGTLDCCQLNRPSNSSKK
ncbi:LDCC motif putative metal-binding protein [Clostridium thermosuccinogenes]|nr:LDCC motif putative metal-binding protein [Pseudoclostridium thermosuccinogenes]